MVAKATYVPASVEDASFLRILMPAFPAYLLLTASVVLLVPGVRARPRTGVLHADSDAAATIALAAAVAVFAVLPLGVIAATPVLKDGGRQVVIFDDNLLPVSSDVGLQANAANGAVRLSWHAQQPRATDVFFRVLRAKSSHRCVSAPEHGQPTSAGSTRRPVAATKGGSYDDQPGPGTWTYRIGVSANWLDDPRLGDVYVAEPACHRDGSVAPFAQLLLEQREPLGEDRVLVGEPRDHRRVVQQHDQDEERTDRAEDRGRIRLDAEPAGDRVRDRRARPTVRAAPHR